MGHEFFAVSFSKTHAVTAEPQCGNRVGRKHRVIETIIVRGIIAADAANIGAPCSLEDQSRVVGLRRIERLKGIEPRFGMRLWK